MMRRVYIYIYIDTHTRISQKVLLFFFSTGIITNTRTYTIHQNETGPLWITSLLPNIVTLSLSSNVPPSNESMYPYLIKFRYLDPIISCGTLCNLSRY